MADVVPEREAVLFEEWSEFSAFLMSRFSAAVGALICLGMIAVTAGVNSAAWWLVGLCFFDLSLQIPYYQWGRARRFGLRDLALRIMFVEVLFLTAVAYMLGPANDVWVLPIYVYLAVAAGALHSPRGALAVGAAASAAYATLALSVDSGLIPAQPSPFPFAFSAGWPWSTILLNSVACIALAMGAGRISQTSRRLLTRSKALEAELREVNRGLEERIDEAVRALRLANDSLATKNRELERTLNQVNLFATAVSHDLRNPVTAAGEALRLAQRSEEMDRDRMVVIARENLIRADRMLVGLRDLMRNVGSRSAVRTVEVKRLIEDVLAELRVARGGAEIPVRIAGDLDTIVTRPDRLAHVFRNLITNALEHNEEQADLSIELGKKEVDDGPAFFVRDNGVGIAPEVQARIFEPFHRGPGEMLPPEGLGLGLALVAAIVNQAGGQVWVESKAQVGTIFSFTFPEADADQS